MALFKIQMESRIIGEENAEQIARECSDSDFQVEVIYPEGGDICEFPVMVTVAVGAGVVGAAFVKGFAEESGKIFAHKFWALAGKLFKYGVTEVNYYFPRKYGTDYLRIRKDDPKALAKFTAELEQYMSDVQREHAEKNNEMK